MKFGMNLLLWTGDMTDDILPVLESLKAMGYDGWLVFEHEKRWRADLDEPELIMPKFVEYMQKHW